MRTAPDTYRVTPVQPLEFEPHIQLVLEHIRLLARRRAAWLDFLQDEADATQEPLEDRDNPARESEWLAGSTPELNTRLDEIETALEQPHDSRLGLLYQIFAFSRLDREIFQACLALALDPTLGSVFAYLHGRRNRAYVTEELVARLFGLGRTLAWPADSALKRWQMIQTVEIGPGEPALLACDQQVRDWLLGASGPHPRLAGRVALRPALPAPDGWPVSQAVSFIQRLTSAERQTPVWVQVSGLEGSGRRTFSACVAKQLGLPLLTIDADAIPATEWEQDYLLIQRQAFLDSWALAWSGDNLADRRWPADVPGFPVQFVITAPNQAVPVPAGKAAASFRLPPLTVKERLRLWQKAIPASASWPKGELATLAARFQATPGDIAAAARQGIDSPAAAAQSVRIGQRERLGRLAQRLECPFGWSDLIVNDSLSEMLDDFAFEARERSLFWEQANARRLFPQGRGLAALFTGPPGTGKTMAAQVIAAALGLDLFRVDLSSVVSKYVGETSQNLERILARAEHMDIVLFFDEADALFGKRTEIKDAHDRFANTDTNYLLQAIENYAGIVLMATNKKANIDPAFIRRLRYVLDFPAPDENQRLAIWERIIAGLTDEDTATRLEPRLKTIASEVKITGAQIKFSILAAVFVARKDGQPLDVQHLLRGLKRELLKEGRSLNEREMEKLRA